MKSKSSNLDHADKREGACRWRRSPTTSQNAERPGSITRPKSNFLRPPFSPSSSPVSSSPTSDLYPRFLKLFRHSFGNKRSPYHNQCQAWLSSLGSNNVCGNCWQTRWKCDSQGLRCQSCIVKHATCPRTLQFKKFLIMREMNITEDIYDKLVKLIPRARNRKLSIGSSSSHPPVRQSFQLRRKSSQKQVASVPSDMESAEVDELDVTEPSSDDRPLYSKLLSNRSSQPMEVTRLTQVRQSAQVASATTNRGPISSPIPTSTLPAPPVPMVVASLDSARVIDELSSIRSALARMEEHLSNFLPYPAKSQPLSTTDRGTDTIPPSPFFTTVLESPQTQNSESLVTRSRMNILGFRADDEGSGNENTETTLHIQTGGERELQRSTNKGILGVPMNTILGERFMTPAHVLPMIMTLDERDVLTDNEDAVV